VIWLALLGRVPWHLVALAAAIGVQTWRLDSAQEARDAAQAEVTELRTGWNTEREESQRLAAEEIKRITVLDAQIVKGLQDEVAKHRRSADRLRTDVDGLSADAQALRRRVQTAATAGRADAADAAIGVLTGLLDGCERACAEVASFADGSFAVADACLRR
jgi:molecular chaperone GrpE (heat shock protein)